MSQEHLFWNETVKTKLHFLFTTSHYANTTVSSLKCQSFVQGSYQANMSDANG